MRAQTIKALVICFLVCLNACSKTPRSPAEGSDLKRVDVNWYLEDTSVEGNFPNYKELGAYIAKHRSGDQTGISKSEILAKKILAVAKCFGVDPVYLSALYQQETTFNESLSSSGGNGLGQITPVAFDYVSNTLFHTYFPESLVNSCWQQLLAIENPSNHPEQWTKPNSIDVFMEAANLEQMLIYSAAHFKFLVVYWSPQDKSRGTINVDYPNAARHYNGNVAIFYGNPHTCFETGQQIRDIYRSCVIMHYRELQKIIGTIPLSSDETESNPVVSETTTSEHPPELDNSPVMEPPASVDWKVYLTAVSGTKSWNSGMIRSISDLENPSLNPLSPTLNGNDEVILQVEDPALSSSWDFNSTEETLELGFAELLEGKTSSQEYITVFFNFNLNLSSNRSVAVISPTTDDASSANKDANLRVFKDGVFDSSVVLNKSEISGSSSAVGSNCFNITTSHQSLTIKLVVKTSKLAQIVPTFQFQESCN